MPLHEGRYTMLWRKTSAGVWLIERYIDHSAAFMEAGERGCFRTSGGAGTSSVAANS